MLSLPVIIAVCVLIVAIYLVGRAQGYHVGKEIGPWHYKMVDLPDDVLLICSSMNTLNNVCSVRRAKIRWWHHENYWEVQMGNHAQTVFGKTFKLIRSQSQEGEIRIFEEAREVGIPLWNQ